MGQDLRRRTSDALCFRYVLVLQGVEGFVKGLVVPLVSCDLVVGHPSKGIDQMVAQVWVDVVRHKFSQARPILGPVGEVTRQHIGSACREIEERQLGEKRAERTCLKCRRTRYLAA